MLTQAGNPVGGLTLVAVRAELEDWRRERVRWLRVSRTARAGGVS